MLKPVTSMVINHRTTRRNMYLRGLKIIPKCTDEYGLQLPGQDEEILKQMW